MRVGRVRGRIARGPTPAKAVSWRLFFLLLLVSFLAFVGLLLLLGWSFYSTAPLERSVHPHYRVLKPSGAVGHSLGIVGTAMMLMIFLYSLRKRWKFLQTIGTQAQWLQVHIFLGFAGPVLVTFHTTGKLGGIVSVAFYSMWAMVLSGMVGRYLYAKIPRTMQGNQMTLKEIEDQLTEIVNVLRHTERKEEVLKGIDMFLARTRKQRGGVISAVVRVVRDDLKLPFNALKVWTIVGGDRGLSFSQRLRVGRLVLRQQRLLNHLAVLEASKRLFSYWHIFHKPFTVLTFVIVSLHIAVAVYLGYGIRW
jgi:hypothetical protein